MTTGALDAFRAGRQLKPITSSKELQLLRQFCGFCADRRWSPENVAARIKSPRNIKPNDVEPFTPGEVSEIIKACDAIGRTSYERRRARKRWFSLSVIRHCVSAMSLCWARDRISDAGNRWRIFLRTEKSGKPVFLPIPGELKDALDALPLPRGTDRECRVFSLERHHVRASDEGNRRTDSCRRVQEVRRTEGTRAPVPAHASN